MTSHAADVVKVADTQIQHLAEQSKIMDQETRVSVYTFSYQRDIKCLIYDKDVLRMPSISGLYKTNGMTALCSATTLAVKDLQLTPEKYGEHAFLLYVVTDGMENDSSPSDRTGLPGLIKGLPDHWTLAAFVPDAQGVYYAKSLGFQKDNIAVWNTNMDSGFLEVGQIIRESTDNFMRGRAQGIRGSKSLFTMKNADVKDIKKTLTPMTPGSYFFAPVTSTDYPDGKVRIDEFCNRHLGNYYPGMGYYEMTKRETIQDYKKIAIYVPADSHLYTGKGTRSLLGLPETGNVKIAPGDHQGYKIFVQSTANNRNLYTDTDLLVMR